MALTVDDEGDRRKTIAAKRARRNNVIARRAFVVS